MKAELSRKSFVDALGVCAGIAPLRTTKPILEHVLLRATETGCFFAGANNLRTWADVSVDGDVSEAGAICVPAKRVHDLVKSLPGDRVDVSVKGETLTLRSGTVRTQVKGLSTAEFPEALPLLENVTWDISAGGLRRAFTLTLPSAMENPQRWAFDCVEIATERDGKTARFIATDGKRVAIARLEGVFPTLATPCLFPVESARAILAVLSEVNDKEIVTLRMSKQAISAAMPGALVGAQVSQGSFPTVIDVLPSFTPMGALLSCELFGRAMHRACAFSEWQKGDAGRFETNAAEFRFEGDRLIVTRASEILGDTREEVPVKWKGAPVARTGFFMPRFWEDGIEALLSVGEREVEISLDEDGENPGVIEAPGFTLHVLPITIQKPVAAAK